MLVFAAFAFVSCEKADPRDEFVGTYFFTQTSTITYTADGESQTTSQSGSGAMQCIKVGSGNQVRLTGMGDTSEGIDGFVNGNTLELSPTTVKSTNPGGTVEMTTTYEPVVKEGDTMTCIAHIIGSMSNQGLTMDIIGEIIIVAVKQ